MLKIQTFCLMSSFYRYENGPSESLNNSHKVMWLEVGGCGPPKALFNAVLNTAIYNYEQGNLFLIHVLM